MRSYLWLFVLIFSACSSVPLGRQLDDVKVGMDKDLVLQMVGNPKRTFRLNSQDHWTYVYFDDNEEWRRQVDFADGKVAKVGRAIAKKDWVNELENAQTMEEYESKARAHQKKAAEFKPLDGGH